MQKLCMLIFISTLPNKVVPGPREAVEYFKCDQIKLTYTTQHNGFWRQEKKWKNYNN